MKFFRWISSKLSKKVAYRCVECYRKMTNDEVYWYGNTCEKCEKESMKNG